MWLRDESEPNAERHPLGSTIRESETARPHRGSL